MIRTFSRILLLALVVALVMFALPLSVQADGGEGGFVQLVNGYEVMLALAQPAIVGENLINVRIHDSEEVPVSGAHVEVRLAAVEDGHEEAQASSGHDMPGMDMPDEISDAHDEMQAVRLEPAHESGEYSGEIHIESAGDYIIAIHMTVGDEPMEVEFPLTVQRDSKYGVLTGFAGINIMILIVAAVLKPKRSQNKILKA